MSSDHSRTAFTQIYVSVDGSSVGASSSWSWPVCEVPAISAERRYGLITFADGDEMSVDVECSFDLHAVTTGD
jgi:hypothetical protein